MNYPTPGYGPAVPVVRTSTNKIIVIVVIVVVIILVILAAIGIALGVGLGVGLSRKGASSSGSGTTTYPILSPPTVTCTYSGPETCGCSARQPSFATPRIYQGYNVVDNSWPWIVALSINGKSFCGGFLVTYQHVVTAAHCVDGQSGNRIVAIAGIQKLSSASSGQARSVSSFTIAPGYTSSSNRNDIAVLTLSSPFAQTSTVGKCCLTSDTSLPGISEHGVIAGWGTTSTGSSLSDDLLQAVIQVQTSASCSISGIATNQFCAGYAGTSGCSGDSGSPFMTSVNNSWTCTGIVSSGIRCGGNTIFTRASAFRSFIDGIING